MPCVSFLLTRTEYMPRRLGSPGFMSPQQARGEPPALTDDVFALGSNLQILCKEFEGQPSANQRLVIGTGKIVAICQSDEPAKRFQSASALGIALEKCVSESYHMLSRAMSFAKTRPSTRLLLQLYYWPLSW